MPITPPNLDDLRFNSIVEDLRRRIPVYAPEWTDHNDSDPGITLIHLFAHLAEQVGYRLDRVPEKTHVALLELLGTRLAPAQAARTRIALLLADPTSRSGYRLAQGARVKASTGDPPPTFETDEEIDVTPAQPVSLIITKNPYLWDLRLLDAEADLPDTFGDSGGEPQTETGPWLDVVWDGKSPKLKDMPIEPVSLASSDATLKPYLWIGLNFNTDRGAGFRGVRVNLTIQFDDDEQPSRTSVDCCKSPALAGEPYTEVTWLHYYDEDSKRMERVPGRIEDSTERLSHSGTITFEVPSGIGELDKEFAPLKEASVPKPTDVCTDVAKAMQTHIRATSAGAPPGYCMNITTFQRALTRILEAVPAVTAEPTAAVPHPLAEPLRKAMGWLRFELEEDAERPKIRMITFNAVAVTHARTIRNELIGTSDGTAGQSYLLANRNVLPGTLEIEIQEESDQTLPLVVWSEGDLDAADPFDRVFEFDPEAGRVTFGDGRTGRIPPLVPRAGRIVARKYTHGGGKSGNVPTADITAMETPANGVSGVVNFTCATGGKDAEDLKAAKLRARKELSTRYRAVTATDFEWIAGQTPAVDVARVHIVPLRAPLARPVNGSDSVEPGGAVPAGASGLAPFEAHGAVSVVVVPREEVPEPTPTPSFLRAVGRHLDKHRLVTTEVCVVPPQYVRLYNFDVRVRARAGFTRAELQELLLARLSEYLHVLKGGDDGTGYPFGTQLHIAQIAAQIMRTEGVERLDAVEARFIRTKSNADPPAGRLIQCEEDNEDRFKIDLAEEETVSVDTSTFKVSTVA